MTKRQIELARHAVGLPNARNRSYRNAFVAGVEHPDHSDWDAMVDAGSALVHRNMASMAGNDLFWLTRAGAEEALQPGETLDTEDFPSRSQ